MAEKRISGEPLHNQATFDFGSRPETTQSDSVRVTCTHCGKRTSVPRWFEKEGLQLYFCSDRCRRGWRDDHRVEVNVKPRRECRGGNWGTVAKQIRERDGFRCRSCDVTEETLGRQLDVHHVVPFRAFDSVDRANHPDNLISLCPSCHKKSEEAGHEDLPLFGKGEAPWR